jgi:hypothetical protein
MNTVRATVHQQLDSWLDTLSPVFEQEKPPTLSELSHLFTQTRGDLLGSCLQSFSEELYAQYKDQRQITCPHCHKLLNRKRIDPKQLNTLQGSMELERPYFYCRDCKQGFHPMDQAMELARTVHQFDLQEKVLKHATELPFELAAQLVGELIGQNLSNHFSHDTLQRVSEIADLETVIPSEEEIQRRIQEVAKNQQEKPVLVVAMDGAHAPTRKEAKRDEKRGKGEWKEVKGVRLYLAPEEGPIIQIASWHQIQDASAMRDDLLNMAKRIPQQSVHIALLGDGASWIWNIMVECFPGGHQVLDYYHCSEHLHKVANIHYGDTPQAIQWVEATMARISADRTNHVIAGLRRMEPSTHSAAEEIEKLITYLTNQSHRLGYDACREKGLPIGSGGIESANKFISHVRLKRSGAWWVIEKGNGMLRLRCALYNGTFDQVFEKYRRVGASGLGTNW